MALGERPRGSKLLVVGYYNANLVIPEGVEQYQDITADLVAVELENMSEHFLLFQRPWC